MIAPVQSRRADQTAPLQGNEALLRGVSRIRRPQEYTFITTEAANDDGWDEPSEFRAIPSSTGEMPEDAQAKLGTEASSPKVNTERSERTFSQPISVLHTYSVRVQKIVDATAYVHLSEDDGAALYAKRNVNDFGGLSIQEGDFLTLRVYIEDNELKHEFERRSNSLDHEAYEKFCNDLADICPE